MANLAKNSEVTARSIKVVEGKETHGDIRMKLMKSGEQMNLLEIKYAPGAGAPLHVHQHETLCYVVEGKVRVTVADEVFELGPGDACIHPPGFPTVLKAWSRLLSLRSNHLRKPLISS